MSVGAANLDGMLSTLGLNRQFAEQLGKAMGVNARDPAAMQKLLYTMYASLNLNNGQGTDHGNAIPPSGYVGRPGEYALQNMGGAQAIPPTGQGFGGLSGDAPFGNTPWARSLQVAMLRNPEFQKALEKQLGGVVVPDGAPDGRLSMWRPPANIRVGQQMRTAVQQGVMPRTGFAGVLSGMNIPMAGNPMAAGGVSSPILKGLMGMEANIMSTVKGFSGGEDPKMQAMAKQTGVNLQNANFEDIVFLSMMTFAGKKETEIMGKVQALDKSMVAGNAQASTAAPPAGEAQQYMGGMFEAGGTTAAQMGINTVPPAGRPQFAVPGSVPAGGQPGQVFDDQGNMVGAPEKMSDTMKQQMLQKLMGDLQKMYEMISNMLKSMHDMQMTPIRNLKG